MEPASQSDRLFEALPDKPRADPPGEATRSAFARTGILPSQAIRAMIAGGEIMAAPEIEANQIQPASLDLGSARSPITGRVSAWADATVRDKLTS
jgi:dCTP deaminase